MSYVHSTVQCADQLQPFSASTSSEILLQESKYFHSDASFSSENFNSATFCLISEIFGFYWRRGSGLLQSKMEFQNSDSDQSSEIEKEGVNKKTSKSEPSLEINISDKFSLISKISRDYWSPEPQDDIFQD